MMKKKAMEIFETYLNGNISDARAAMQELPPLEASAVVAYVVTSRSQHDDFLHHDARRFAEAVIRWA